MSLSLEDKKLLAEWLYPKGFWDNEMEDWIVKKSKSSIHVFGVSEWDPDINHEDFKEVWNKLTIDQTNQILCNLVVIDPGYMAHLILNDLPRVCKAIIEVIK